MFLPAHILFSFVTCVLKFEFFSLLCVCEPHAKVVLDLICSKNSPNAAYSSLLFDCRLLLDKIPHTTVKHVFQEANKCAVALVRIGCDVQ